MQSWAHKSEEKLKSSGAAVRGIESLLFTQIFGFDTEQM